MAYRTNNIQLPKKTVARFWERRRREAIARDKLRKREARHAARQRKVLAREDRRKARDARRGGIVSV